MIQNGHNADSLEVALLTVHVDAETLKQIREASSHLPWTLIPIDYENYFSATKLPPLTQRAIQAQACVAVVNFDPDPELALQTAECSAAEFLS